MGLRRHQRHLARSASRRRLPNPGDATRPVRLRRWMVTDPITDRQWGAYVAVCAERDCYREALRRIVHGGPHDPQYIALDALDSTDQGDDA